MTNDEAHIRAAVNRAIEETVGPALAGLEAIQRAAADTNDDQELGRRVRAILDLVRGPHAAASSTRGEAVAPRSSVDRERAVPRSR